MKNDHFNYILQDVQEQQRIRSEKTLYALNTMLWQYKAFFAIKYMS